MNYLKRFSIQFAGLKEGIHQFEYIIEDMFFEYYSESEIKKGNVNVQIELQKMARMFVLNFKIKGEVYITCDRCLDDFIFYIDKTNKLIVKIGKEKLEETDEIIIIPETEHEINIAQYIYEYIHLALPSKRTHPEDKDGFSFCNKEIIEKLLEHKKSNKEINTNWDILKNLKLN